MNPLVGDCLCVYRAFSVGLCMFGMCISLAPVIYIYIYIYIYFVVTLTIIHERAPPTLDDGLPSDTVGREDDGGFLGPQ
jgi:hypothetical protein